MGIDLTCASIFVAALATSHVVLHVVLLVLRVGDDSVAVDVVTGQGMIKAGAAHHAEGGGTKSNRAKGGVQVDGRFHGRNVLGMNDFIWDRFLQELEGWVQVLLVLPTPRVTNRQIFSSIRGSRAGSSVSMRNEHGRVQRRSGVAPYASIPRVLIQFRLVFRKRNSPSSESPLRFHRVMKPFEPPLVRGFHGSVCAGDAR